MGRLRTASGRKKDVKKKFRLVPTPNRLKGLAMTFVASFEYWQNIQ